MLIGGRLIRGAAKTIGVDDPAIGQTVTSVVGANVEQVDAALLAARRLGDQPPAQEPRFPSRTR
ncbi:MAG: hypothetical protein QOF66_7730 [Mycobacterium sp.]|nr:hypothetical protein [Mycobacterium sp.]